MRPFPSFETSHLRFRVDGPQSEDLLRPVFMGCATKNAKVVAISLGSMQRLIALKAVPHSAVPVIITTMSDCMNQGVDIQLRILQTLLSLITNFPAVHGALLGDVGAVVFCKCHLLKPNAIRRCYCVLNYRNQGLRWSPPQQQPPSDNSSCLWSTR